MLVQQAAQQYRPENRDRFVEYIRNEPLAAAQLRAPLYEDKVVDWLFDKAEISDREVTREELEAAIESEDGFATGTHVHDHDHDHDHTPKKKPAKKKAAEPEVSETADAPAEAPEVPAPKAKKATKPVAKGSNAGVDTEGTDADGAAAASAKKPRAKKAAPVTEETQVLESSLVAAEAAEGTEAADAAPAKKPRAKKKAEG